MINNKTYDVLKWVVITVLPALSVLISAVGNELGITDTNTVVTILNALTVFLGTSLGVSSVRYKKGEE